VQPKSEKSIHPLFHLLNFIYSAECLPFELTDLDKLILIGIMKHLGKEGIFVSQKTLAHELNVHIKTMERIIK
jgi:hypothetical protein